MSWIYYLLEANLYLLLFYGFYKLLLQKETFYVLNRYYLVLSSFTAFLLPFMQLGFLTKSMVSTEGVVYQTMPKQTSIFTIENAILTIYIIISLFFLSKLFYGFKHILRLLKKQGKRKENGITIVELANTKTAFSFFNFLFIDPELSEKATVLNHEMVHIRQKHSLDVLFFELIGSFSWFNPVTHLLKNDIKLLHEYLADEDTTNKGIEKYDYAMFLIQNSYGNNEIKLTNQIFNSSILKRRINMLNQKKSAKWARLRLLMVLPLTGAMLCSSAMAFTKNYGVIDLYPKKEKMVTISIQEPAAKKLAPPPPPVEPAPLAKTNKKAKALQIKLAPPPPPVEPDSRKGNKKAVNNLSKEATEIEITPVKEIEIIPTQKDKKSSEEIVVVGYGVKDKNTDKIVPLNKKATNDKSSMEEVVVIGYGKKKQ